MLFLLSTLLDVDNNVVIAIYLLLDALYKVIARLFLVKIKLFIHSDGIPMSPRVLFMKVKKKHFSLSSVKLS